MGKAPKKSRKAPAPVDDAPRPAAIDVPAGMPSPLSAGGRVTVTAAFLLTGACGLVYENVWIHGFNRIFGSTLLAVSTVVAVFFAGLALGGRLFGRWSVASRRPALVYGLIELGVGAFALVFPLLLGLVDTLYGALHPALGVSFAALTAARVLLACLVLIVPSVLMGGTLPLLTRLFTRDLASLGKRSGFLYGVNAVGAALGCLLFSGWLLRAFGMGAAGFGTGIANILLAGVVVWVACRDSDSPGTPVEPPARPLLPPLSRTARTTVAAFAVSGFVSMSFEILWLRHLSILMGDTLHLYAGTLAVFVLGIGLGSLAMGAVGDRVRLPLRALGILQSAMAALTAGGVALSLSLSATFTEPSVGAPGVLSWALPLLVLPSTLTMGAAFPLVARVITEHAALAGERVGRAYALNTLGCILGTLLTGFVSLPLLGFQATLVLLVFGNAALTLVYLCAEPGRVRRLFVPAAAVAVVFGTFLWTAFTEQTLPRALVLRLLDPGQELIEIREGLTGVTWASQSPDREVSLGEGRVLIGRNRRGNFVGEGFFSTLLSPGAPRRVLSLAFGAGLSSFAVRLLPELERLDAVDISADNMAVARSVFPENEGIESDPRVRFYVDDACSFVRYAKGRYDLILTEATPPMFAYRASSLYTLEYYRHARACLAPGGVFSQVLPLTNLNAAEVRSVVRTFAEVFPHRMLAYNGADCLMLGRGEPFRFDGAALLARLGQPAFAGALERYALGRLRSLPNLLASILLVDGDFAAVGNGGALLTEDFNPLVYSSESAGKGGAAVLLHERLTPWSRLGACFRGLPPDASNPRRIEAVREGYMTLLYPPEEFRQRYLDYLRRHALDPAGEAKPLIRHLEKRGDPAGAEAVRREFGAR
ncbi:MAG: fused MFS/spermidine synthase [Acidobacteria bacterium]|nr:fused MFS/spermidine synthase [Acidobacteriota bacterium]